jgi:hypothetical protein
MVDFSNWTLKSSKADPSRGDYFLGVVIAMNVAQRKSQPMTKAQLDVQSVDTALGYHSGIALINKVVALGDAPEGGFADLLAAPYMEELIPKQTKRGPSR